MLNGNMVQIPTHEKFLRLGEALSQNPKIQFFKDGLSCQNRELLFFKIGNGEKVIGVTGGAHAHEPTGLATTYELIQNLASNSHFELLLDKYTFAIFPMLDPDGSVLNENWTQHNLSYKSFFLHHYKEERSEWDCEHGIPVLSTQKIRPELEFFRRHMDQFKGRVEFYVTLHTTHVLGGAIFIVDRDFKNENLFDSLGKIAKSHGLPLWDYKSPGKTMNYIRKGFIGAPSMRSYIEQFKESPEVLSGIKMSTYEYVLSRCGGKFALISELPFELISGEFADTTESRMLQKELKERTHERSVLMRQRLELDLEEIAKFSSALTNPWFQLAQYKIENTFLDEAKFQEKLKKYGDERALVCDVRHFEKVSEIEGELERHRLYIKCLEGIPQAQNIYLKHLTAFDQLFERYEKNYPTQKFPIEKQISIQMGMIFSPLKA